MDNNLVRLQKLIAHSGFCSRRKAEEYIEKGKVLVNGNKAKIGDLGSFNDEIIVNGKLIQIQNKKLEYFILNKPEKTISTAKDPQKRRTVVDLITTTDQRLVPVGRLDYDTTGLLLLTNDLEMVNKLTHPKYEIKRIYRVRINEPLTLKEFREINKGVMVNGKMSKQIVNQVEKKSYTVELHVGSYHHIKELFAHFDRKVINLKRLQYANLKVDEIPKGWYRPLKPKELKDLKQIIRLQEAKLAKEEKETKAENRA
ncbi:pseudouridine synthase [Mycoplasmopsis iners]|uniref:pseudouridine synthase n=1 Tax=Mycoplasmopsis iners TaxID=76630 RepID=UPI00049640C6|nr:pseudouridine synthase [Mycoplasmopsis iners]